MNTSTVDETQGQGEHTRLSKIKKRVFRGEGFNPIMTTCRIRHVIALGLLLLHSRVGLGGLVPWERVDHHVGGGLEGECLTCGERNREWPPRSWTRYVIVGGGVREETRVYCPEASALDVGSASLQHFTAIANHAGNLVLLAELIAVALGQKHGKCDKRNPTVRHSSATSNLACQTHASVSSKFIWTSHGCAV